MDKTSTVRNFDMERSAGFLSGPRRRIVTGVEDGDRPGIPGSRLTGTANITITEEGELLQDGESAFRSADLDWFSLLDYLRSLKEGDIFVDRRPDDYRKLTG